MHLKQSILGILYAVLRALQIRQKFFLFFLFISILLTMKLFFQSLSFGRNKTCFQESLQKVCEGLGIREEKVDRDG
jgi:hypothetical protein